MSHVLKTEPVSLPRVLEGRRPGGEGLVSVGEAGLVEGVGGGAGGLDGGGGHAAQGEGQCPGDCHQQHLERIILDQARLLGIILCPQVYFSINLKSCLLTFKSSWCAKCYVDAMSATCVCLG